MAKSTRSKVKRQFRAKKREQGVYAATEAARLNRLHQKLKSLTTKEAGEVEEEVVSEFSEEQDMKDESSPVVVTKSTADDAMEMDPGADISAESNKCISTHGPRGSRREEWRKSKGLSAKPKSKGMNKQGLPAARRKAGRSHRRR